MKKKIITGIAAMTFAIALTLNVSISMSNDGKVSDITFDNIEALASEDIIYIKCTGSGLLICPANEKPYRRVQIIG